MTEYRRATVAGGTYFFTLNCLLRQHNHLLTDHIDTLRNAFQYVKQKHPFDMPAVVILPDHLHCIWQLPDGDMDYKTRWSLVKSHFSRSIPMGEQRSLSRLKRGERGIWQRRYWEHLIRDEMDYAHHTDYIHWNPVKHGWVPRVSDWPYSSFHRHVEKGVYLIDWAGSSSEEMETGEAHE
ncbi:REP-associated tyrosine transposase [Sedimenticola hydrogenitrophicus]|uniref:REP-associated tyrosine transposase n=1 Tax=Sedimenticola hydrogenitrophicus TaxID=2967975 RepID=UPI0023AE7A7F|nr:transposase [Sedimenticola hydrogenitrophicus]